MRIAFLLRKFPVLSETFILNQIIGLIQRGHEVDIFAIYQGESITHQEYQAFNLHNRTRYPTKVPVNPLLRVLKLSLILPLRLANWRRLLPTLNIVRFQRQAKSLYLTYLSTLFLDQPKVYDIIHCHFGLMGLIGCDLRELGFLHGQIVTSFHGSDVNTYPQKNGLDIYKRLFKEGQIFTVNSEFTGHKLTALGCSSELISKLPVGVDLSKFPSSLFEVTKKELVNVLSVGRLVECKGFEYAIRAISTLITKYPFLRYKIIGDGSLYQSLQTLIQTLDTEAYIELVGAQPHDVVIKSYKEADIFILPSVIGNDGAEEGQGLVIQEAQASYLPVIASDIGGISDGMISGKSGYLVPQRDSAALATGIEHLIKNPEKRKSMGYEGRKIVEEQYDQRKLLDRLEVLYSSILSNAE